ncbi:hypothetical protein LCGC14_1962600 [marine sediment metagenome]|uniref:DUF3467 domain-containing protein n=1 Tax=marine sediment metagenome TaxID=412755 RepID=A0A0F9HSI4_9ZZZZ
MSKNQKPIGRHVFEFDPRNSGGESFSLTTEFFEQGDPGVYFTNQELKLQSYCNSASFNLSGVALNPALLRQLANELEEEGHRVKAKLAKISKEST